jgi:hypothetical protein
MDRLHLGQQCRDLPVHGRRPGQRCELEAVASDRPAPAPVRTERVDQQQAAFGHARPQCGRIDERRRRGRTGRLHRLSGRGQLRTEFRDLALDRQHRRRRRVVALRERLQPVPPFGERRGDTLPLCHRGRRRCSASGRWQRGFRREQRRQRRRFRRTRVGRGRESQRLGREQVDDEALRRTESHAERHAVVGVGHRGGQRARTVRGATGEQERGVAVAGPQREFRPLVVRGDQRFAIAVGRGQRGRPVQVLARRRYAVQQAQRSPPTDQRTRDDPVRLGDGERECRIVRVDGTRQPAGGRMPVALGDRDAGPQCRRAERGSNDGRLRLHRVGGGHAPELPMGVAEPEQCQRAGVAVRFAERCERGLEVRDREVRLAELQVARAEADPRGGTHPV